MKILLYTNPIYFKSSSATQPRLPGPESGANDSGKQLVKTLDNKLPQDTLQLKQKPLLDNKNCSDCV